MTAELAVKYTHARVLYESPAESKVPVCEFHVTDAWGVFGSADRDVHYFWTSTWQAGEREADDDIREGRVISFDDAGEAIQYLRSLANEKDD